ncbi:hypothetical protein FIBSPDRAFT_847812, partial [Athelia psychrophila]
MSILPAEYHYILFALAPPCDALLVRKALQDALAQAFGLTSAGTHMDVLWVSPPSPASSSSSTTKTGAAERRGRWSVLDRRACPPA